MITSKLAEIESYINGIASILKTLIVHLTLLLLLAIGASTLINHEWSSGHNGVHAEQRDGSNYSSHQVEACSDRNP